MAEAKECKSNPGRFIPVIDRNKCEGKADCVSACPRDVFEVRVMDPVDFDKLSFLGKLKSRAHGKKTAYTPKAAACEECGACVAACPEKAITLLRVSRTA
ncbi:MAG: 4Fe-4S dicluster domain-containing protein [Myxococcota bacterium]